MITTTKTFVLSAAVAALVSFGAGKTYADSSCVTQYGGSQYGTNCAPNDLVINKEVQKPGEKGSDGGPVYVENLSVSDATASAGTHMTFRLTIKNNSGQTFDPVEVKDIFPPYMSYVSGGPSGTVYDPATRTMTAKLEKMIAGESRQLIIVTKIEDPNAFPAGKSTFCVVNTAQARALDRFDEDTAQVCINSDKKGFSNLPKAGFNDLLVFLPFAALGVIGAGLVTKKI